MSCKSFGICLGQLVLLLVELSVPSIITLCIGREPTGILILDKAFGNLLFIVVIFGILLVVVNFCFAINECVNSASFYLLSWLLPSSVDVFVFIFELVLLSVFFVVNIIVII